MGEMMDGYAKFYVELWIILPPPLGVYLFFVVEG